MKGEGFSDSLCTFFRNCGVVDPSWAELRHFVNFLDSQLKACETSTFCNGELVGDSLRGFRSFVVDFMILMSRVREMERCDCAKKRGPIPGAATHPNTRRKCLKFGRRWAPSML